MIDKPAGSPSDYLAAERTFLAWIRTGLALMGFGFVVARFGLFLQSLQIVQPNLHLRNYGPSFWFGTGLIVLGVVVNVLCAWSHIRLVHDLQRGGSGFARPSSLAISVAAILAAIGLAMAIYLVWVREPQEKSMTSKSENGIVTIPSGKPVDQTVQDLQGILQAKGVKLFAVIDHSGEAEKAGLQMRPTKLLIFGNPKAGTPLMAASPSSAIDLPLKILIAEDADGKVWISYNDPTYLQTRHGLPAELLQNIAVVGALANKAAELMGKLALLIATAGLLAFSQQSHQEITRPASPAEDSRPNSANIPDVYAISGQFKRVLILRFKFDTDLLAGLQKMVTEQKVKNGVILSAIGSVRGYQVHAVSNRTFPSKNLFVKDPTAPADIIGMNGYILNGRVHPHITLSSGDRAFGGHLEPGTNVFTFALVTLGVFNDEPDFSRLDDQTYR